MPSILELRIESRTCGVFAARSVREMPDGSIGAPLPEPGIGARAAASLVELPGRPLVSRSARGDPIGAAIGDAICGSGTVGSAGSATAGSDRRVELGARFSTVRGRGIASGGRTAGVGRRKLAIRSDVTEPSGLVNSGTDLIAPNATANRIAVTPRETVKLDQ
jgi:hypothetical protein